MLDSMFLVSLQLSVGPVMDRCLIWSSKTFVYDIDVGGHIDDLRGQLGSRGGNPTLRRNVEMVTNLRCPIIVMMLVYGDLTLMPHLFAVLENP